MGGFFQTLKSLGPTRLAAMAGVGVALIGFFIYLMARLSQPDMGMLYSDLDLADSGEIVSRLEDLEVPYEVRQNGATILVPKDQVDRLRLLMARDGVPSGGSLGYEIFDRSDGFGVTNFVQNINRLRALEGELARTIATIQGVRQARVHLVLPERELFSRDAQPPTASVFLRLSAAGLSSEQVLAIQHLVAASVPRLQPGDISIVDHQGNLLARGPSGDVEALQLQTAEERRVAYERRLKQTIEDLLSRSLGYGKVRAQVSVAMDFDRVTTSEEIFDPDSSVPRSSQYVQDEAISDEGGAIDPVTVANALPERQNAGPGGAAGAAGASNRTTRSEETINYEISSTVRRTVREGGTLRRLSVAVLVDGTYEPGLNGDVVYVPRGTDELTQIESLVQSAIGYSAERGDVVEVINMQFAVQDQELVGEEEPTLLGFAREDLFQLAEILVLGVVAVLVILLVVRPLLSRLLEGGQPAPAANDEMAGLLTDQSGAPAALTGPGLPADLGGSQALAAADAGSEIDELIDLNRVEGRVRASSVRKVGEIVDKHPEEAASIIRSWIYQEA